MTVTGSSPHARVSERQAREVDEQARESTKCCPKIEGGRL